MCLECDGYSHEEAMQALDLRIRVHGWALLRVVDGSMAWCYTVGLTENYGLPEFVLFDIDTDVQHPLMTTIVDLAIAEGELPVDSFAALGLRHVVIHEDHLRGDLFGTWANRYGDFPQPGEMIQVLLPKEAFCSCHASGSRRLDLPGPLPPLDAPPNRAERRRRGQGGHAA